MSLSSSSSSSETACEPVQLRKLSTTCEGWLYKQSSSSFMKAWRRRYFVLSDERLYIFKDNFGDATSHTIIDLANFKSVQQIANPRKTRHGMVLKSHRRPSVFDDPSNTAKENFEIELYSETAAGLNGWLDAISKLFVTMDMRTFATPLSNFDALLQRAGSMQPRKGGSILHRIDQHRSSQLSHSPSSTTLVSEGASPDKPSPPPLRNIPLDSLMHH
ncbi:hypothetical protein GQ54DRAFT_87749 [Martensiomyces pterosporus]|nr:hypothetical protein GQ54DRAFT_87749 [Martensiomyces pterosporus]